MLPQTVQRHLTDKAVSPRMVWRFNHAIGSMPAGKMLHIETLAPAAIHWSGNDWKTVQDVTAHDTGLGMYLPIWRLNLYLKDNTSNSLFTGPAANFAVKIGSLPESRR